MKQPEKEELDGGLEKQAEEETDTMEEKEIIDDEEEELAQVKTPEEEAAEWKDIALRRQADLENFRKRIERERVDSIRYANASLLEDLFPVIDNFEMGLEAARLESSESMIFKGMEMVKKQLEDFLEARGVKEVKTEHEPFDPTHHEAVGQEETEAVADGHIVRTLRKGYILNDRLLRAASVIVAGSVQAVNSEASGADNSNPSTLEES